MCRAFEKFTTPLSESAGLTSSPSQVCGHRLVALPLWDSGLDPKSPGVWRTGAYANRNSPHRRKVGHEERGDLNKQRREGKGVRPQGSSDRR